MSKKKNENLINKLGKVMLNKLEDNDHQSGWKDCTMSYFFNRVEQEVDELRDALFDGDKEEIKSECADVANFCAMIIDNL